MTDRPYFVSPMGIPYWSHGLRHQRAAVKALDGGAYEIVYEEADDAENGPWVECPKMTVADVQATFPPDPADE